MKKKKNVWMFAATLLLATSFQAALAGPCHVCMDAAGGEAMPPVGFWDERNISDSSGESIEPDIAVGLSLGGPIGASAILIVWSDDTSTRKEANNPEGDKEIWLAVSNDQGCSFTYYQLTVNDTPDTGPAVCYSGMFDEANVAYINGNDVLNIRVTSVSSSPMFQPPEVLNTSIAQIAPANVDVTCAPGQMQDVYAAWDGEVSIGPLGYRHLFFKRSRNGGATGSWQGSDSGPAETDLSTGAGLGRTNSISPSLSSDMFAATSADSSVTILFINDASCGQAGMCTLSYRSRDSGTNFSGDPFAGPLPPLAVSDTTRTIRTSAPANDCNDTGFGGPMVWYAGLWLEDAGGNTPDVTMDAQAEDTTSYQAPWNTPPPSDVPVWQDPQVSALDPALSVLPIPFGSIQDPEFYAFWGADLAGNGMSEIYYNRGRLSVPALAGRKINLPCFMAPFKLTGDFPPRAEGFADFVASDESMEEVYLAFHALAEGDSEIFFKRSDHQPPPAIVDFDALPLICTQVGFRIDWVPPFGCDIDHYRVHYDTDGGPDWDFTVDDITDLFVVIDGLPVQTTYFYTIIAVDEACNEGVASKEGQVETNSCAVVLRPGGITWEDRCPLGLGDRNANPEPGESIADITLEVVNDAASSSPVTGCVGTLTSPAAGVSVVAPGTSAYPVIAPSATAVNDSVFALELDLVGYTCGTPIDLELALSCTEGLFNLSYQIPASPTPCDPCQAAKCPAVPEAIQLLKAARSGVDIDFNWQDDIRALDGYNIWYVLAEEDIPIANINNQFPGPSQPVANCAFPAPAPSNLCTHFGAVSDTDPLYFYQVKGYCVDEEGP